jgi:hypothetical protein
MPGGDGVTGKFDAYWAKVCDILVSRWRLETDDDYIGLRG